MWQKSNMNHQQKEECKTCGLLKSTIDLTGKECIGLNGDHDFISSPPLDSMAERFVTTFAKYQNHEMLSEEPFVSWALKFVHQELEQASGDSYIKGTEDRELEWQDKLPAILKQGRREVLEDMRKLHTKYMSGDHREDIKKCKEPGCDHYTLGADDFYHDFLALSESK